ncbi:hypothetical protein N0V90_007470 [Kalmusia sp. IMI 367209]|nr:hypothetical protein N0V90_007470 [Kalmusia sp. IMI 367209]
MSSKSRLEAIQGHLTPPSSTPTIIVEDEVPAKGPSPEFPQNLRTIFPPLELEEHPVDEVRRLRVVVVGAGISGIIAGVFLPVKVPNIDLVIYERNDDIGGTWHTNIYPGVRCDVPAHAYQATFEASDQWSTAYAEGAEIQAYWKRIVEKYNLVGKYIKLNHRVEKAEWSEEQGNWLITVTSNGKSFIDAADFLVTATGHFADPRLPEYPGRDEFQGHLRHSSNWDPNFDPRGKTIAVIGNGASGLQVVPQLQKVAARVDHYARNKTWVAAPIGGENLAQFVAENIEKARSSPEEYLKFRKQLEVQLYSRFGGIFKDGEKNKDAKEAITKLMKDRLGDRIDLLDSILPDFAPNCRRLTPGPGTGHDISFSTAFPVYANGIDLQSAWRPGGNPGFPDSYLGLAAPNVPNFLTVLGPNATGPAGTLTHAVESQFTYVAKVLRKASSQGIRSMAPTTAATRDFRAYCESFFPRTVMSQYCSSWYNGGIKGGRIHGLWPGSGAHVALVRREPRWEDWEYTYVNPQGNRFAWLGNGWTTRDVKANNGEAGDDLDLTPWLQKEALTGDVDLKGLS